MEIKINNAGMIVCEGADRDTSFWLMVRDCFAFDGSSGIWYAEIEPVYHEYKCLEDVVTPYERLRTIVREASRSFVPMQDGVIQRLHEMEEAYFRFVLQRTIARRLHAAQTVYDAKSRSGCGDCHHVVQRVDEFFCEKTGRRLECRNMPVDRGGVRYLFNLTPFPTDGCVYKKTKGDEEEMSEKALRRLAELIQIAHNAIGHERDEAYRQIGKLIVGEAEFEPLLIHNTDTWSDERMGVE